MARSRRDRDRSKRIRRMVLKLTVAAALLGSASYSAYDHGRRASAAEGALAMAEARRQADAAIAESLRLAEAARQQDAREAELRTALETAQASAERFRTLYEEAAPEAVRGILAEARAKLAEGLSAERLAFLVNQAQEPRDCGAVDTRRFIVRTENYDGANTWVRFDDTVTVTALGAAAEDGRAGWFDTAKSVSVTFAPLGGPRQEISGKLPLHHAFLFKDKEYRFAVVPGRRGFVEVSADWCQGVARERHAEAGG